MTVTNGVERPLGISALAVLSIIGGVLALVAGAEVLWGASAPHVYGYGPLTGPVVTVSGALISLIGIFFLVESWGMWSARGWAWTLGIITGAIAVISSAFQIMLGDLASVLGLLIDLYILWYLWQPHVRKYFGRANRAPIT